MLTISSGTIWAALVGSIAANNVARFPESADIQILPPIRRDLMRKDIDHTEHFRWKEFNETIIDIKGHDNFVVDCIECQMSGSVHTLFDEKLTSLLDSYLNVSFTKTSAYIDVNVIVGAGGEQSIPLWGLPDKISLGSVSIDIGLSLYLNLVISLDGELEATGGFEFTIPDGSWLAASLDGNVAGAQFDGAVGKMLPWSVTSGAATLKVALRLRAELGVGLEAGPIREEAQVGVYLNLIELVVSLEADESDEICKLEATEFLNINAGAYADFDVKKGDTIFSAIPTYSTTFYNGPTATQCLDPTLPTIIVATSTNIGGPGSPPKTSQTLLLTPTSYHNVSKTRSHKEPYGTPTTKAFTTFKYHNSSAISPPAMHTSTICSTKVYTVTSCAAPVVNCPADWAKTIVITQIVDHYVTVCPVTEVQPTQLPTLTTRSPRLVTITDGVTLTRCPTPMVHFFTPPTNVEPPSEHKTAITVTRVIPGQTQHSGITTAASSSQPSSVILTRSVLTTPPHGGKNGTTTPSAAATTPHDHTTPTPTLNGPVTTAGASQKTTTTAIRTVLILFACLLAL